MSDHFMLAAHWSVILDDRLPTKLRRSGATLVKKEQSLFGITLVTRFSCEFHQSQFDFCVIFFIFFTINHRRHIKNINYFFIF